MLDDSYDFPGADEADEHGIIALGGDFCTERLINAYSSGIFPWPHRGLPILWFCPDPRFVLEPQHIVISRTLKKILRTTNLTIKADTNFLAVIKQCQAVHEKRQDGTWITNDMIDGYHALFQQGLAHSIEAYDQDLLVGGLYGVSLGTVFFGESMYFLAPNASKICLVTLVAHLIDWGFSLMDCQAYTEHLERFGAKAIARDNFLKLLQTNQHAPSKKGPWLLHMAPAVALERISQNPI